MQEYCSNLTVNGKTFSFYDLEKAAKSHDVKVGELPYTIRIILESLLRKKDGLDVKESHISVPQVRQAVDLPLIAAGGIATGAGMLAAFALGAEGCQLGTRFALSRESSACEAFKRRCVEVQEGGTILTLKKVIPTRLIRNGFCRTVEEAESRGADAEELSALIGRGRPKRGIFEGDLDEGELEIGQIAALIEDLPPAGEILRRLVAEYEAARGSLGPL